MTVSSCLSELLPKTVQSVSEDQQSTTRNVRNIRRTHVNFTANIVTFQFVHNVFTRKIMTSTKSYLKKYNRQETTDWKRFPRNEGNYLFLFSAQKTGVKHHSMTLTATLNKQGEALHKEINSLIQRKQSEIVEMKY